MARNYYQEDPGATMFWYCMGLLKKKFKINVSNKIKMMVLLKNCWESSIPSLFPKREANVHQYLGNW
jgi:hypothetical protein